jgi:glycosyltransferase involved in cell wall biosynthesis
VTRSTDRPTTAIVIPTKDGMPLAEEVFRAAAAQGADEFLVIDSGSTDGTADAARAAGATVLEIDPLSFGHGRTRNLAVQRVEADLICFLTQDATPLPGWLDAYVDAFAVDERIAAAFGPHVPRPDTSPMIARELIDFFDPFSPDGRVHVQHRLDEPGWHPGFLSNANAAYRRADLLALPFRDVAYAEDQAFARDALAAGRLKAYQPLAAVLHAHDYPWLQFMRRYFDEYRGLHETTGFQTSFYPKGMLRDALIAARNDGGWLQEQGVPQGTRRRWMLRSLRHHGGRRLAAFAGGRSDRIPGPVQRLISLEGRSNDETAPPPPPSSPADEPSAVVASRREPAAPYGEAFAVVAEVETQGVVPLDPAWTADADADALEIAVIVPGFRPGSGGHSTIFTLIEQLERKGHRCSIWLHDANGMHRRQSDAAIAADIGRHFRSLRASVHRGFAAWRGANVVLATGWDTVYAALRLPRTGARAYLIQDHEPEFFATSAERLWAERTYTYGLHPICASRWLADLVGREHGGDPVWFDLGVDHDVYRPRPEIARRHDTIALYGRMVTPRRAGPLATMALTELLRRRGDVRVVAFGWNGPLNLPFAHQHAGVLSPAELSALYNESTVGLTLSLTNYSLVPQEMLACGLPCVDLAGFSSDVAYGDTPPLDLVAPTVPALADALERLLDDRAHWDRRSSEGRAFVAQHTWENAADRVEQGLRAALRTAVAAQP